MMTKCNNVNEMILALMKIDDTLKSSVIDDIEATELHMLLNQLDTIVIRGHEKVIRNKSLVAKAFDNIKSIEKVKEHNDELQKSYIIASLMTPVRKINEPFYTKAEFENIAQNIKNAQEAYKENVKVDTKINYELEFRKDEIGSYNIYFGDNNGAHINIFKPNRIYKNTRLVKNLIEDQESYIETFNFDNDYIIIRNDKLNKFIIFTRNDKHTDTFNYLAPEEYCNDPDRI